MFQSQLQERSHIVLKEQFSGQRGGQQSALILLLLCRKIWAVRRDFPAASFTKLSTSRQVSRASCALAVVTLLGAVRWQRDSLGQSKETGQKGNHILGDTPWLGAALRSMGRAVQLGWTSAQQLPGSSKANQDQTSKLLSFYTGFHKGGFSCILPTVRLRQN